MQFLTKIYCLNVLKCKKVVTLNTQILDESHVVGTVMLDYALKELVVTFCKGTLLLKNSQEKHAVH